MQAAEGPAADRTADFAELRRQLDAADADIVLVNKRLEKAYILILLVHISRVFAWYAARLLCFACSHDANGILLGSIKVMLFVTLQCRN